MDVIASQSPDEPVAPGVDGTPAQPSGPAPDPAAPPAADGGADKATAEPSPSAQAEYTRSQQAFAALKSELGLDPKANRDQVLEAVRQMKSQPAPADGDGEGEPVDPRIAAAELRAWESEMRWQAALHGEEVTNGVIELVNLSREGTNDPETLVTAFAGWLNDEVERRLALAQGQPAPAPAPAGAPAAPVGDIGLSEGDTAPPARPNPPTGGRPEPGTVQAIRGLFQRAAEGR